MLTVSYWSSLFNWYHLDLNTDYYDSIVFINSAKMSQIHAGLIQIIITYIHSDGFFKNKIY